MKHVLAILFLCAAVPAQAACFADYKAKQDDPLRLHYGVAEIRGACDSDTARKQLERRLGRDNWTLLNIVSLFDESGLEDKRENAGEFYLRY